MRVLYFAMLAPVLFAKPVVAQSALETATFILSGGKFEKLSDDAYHFTANQLADRISYRSEVTVYRESDCLYKTVGSLTISFDGGEAEPRKFTGRTDLSTLYGWDISGEKVPIIRLKGGDKLVCTSIEVDNKAVEKCASMRNVVMPSDLERWKSAFAYFKNTFCKGRAF